MSDQSDFDSASQFAASKEVEKAGQDILQSLHKAADVADANRETVQRLSHQLRNAENRIAELESQIAELEAEVQLAGREGQRIDDNRSRHPTKRKN
jgi:chromosome segregation ATPase